MAINEVVIGRLLQRTKRMVSWCWITGLVLFGAAFPATGAAAEAPSLSALPLLGEMGCVQCHDGFPVQSTLRELAPDLSSAGLRYRADYLYDYLLQPRKVRRHLGSARMPGFSLSDAEAVALVLFLQEQQVTTGTWPAMPEGLEGVSEPSLVPREEALALLRDKGRCLNCHLLEGQGGAVGIELSSIGHRLQPDWVRRYLVAPARYGVPPSIMPPPFFALDEATDRFVPLTNQATRAISEITSFLFTYGEAERAAQQARWQQARREHPLVDAAQGETLFSALNCAACHRHHRLAPKAMPAAPDLTAAGSRLQPAWLEAYLRRPTAVRPFGFHPGQGGRMPDFRLSASEVETLSRYLSGLAARRHDPFEPEKLSAFARLKTLRLLRDRYSCLGCHALGGAGGRVAPDLARAKDRLQPGYLRQIIRDPRQVAPHTIMPRPLLTDSAVERLARFLLQHEVPPAETDYLSPLQHGVLPRPSGAGSTGRGRYLAACAPCHGSEGAGDGFNARYLPVMPSSHMDPVRMGARPNDTLHDGIHAGGLILGRSHTMPAWGGTLSPAEISELVGHLRELCRCQPPGWAEERP